MGNGVVRTYGFIRRMVSQTQSGFWSVGFVGVSFQKEPTRLFQEVVFPKRRSSPSCITLLKAADNVGYADWLVQVEMLLVD
jgi:hypothetical protein